jgi:hypothetical protein
MLNPLRAGFYAVQLVSHKVLRYAVPLFLLTISRRRPRSPAVMVLRGGVSRSGAFLPRGRRLASARTRGARSRLLALPQYFVLANLAAVLAFVKFLRGERYASWEPIREPARADGAAQRVSGG